MNIEQLAIKNLEAQIEIYKEVVEAHQRKIANMRENADHILHIVTKGQSDLTDNNIRSIVHHSSVVAVDPEKRVYGFDIDYLNQVNKLMDRLKQLQP